MLKKTFPISIQAHRGFSKKFPQNTLLSFQKAIEAKADYIELDVHSTIEGELVIIHDQSTKRVSKLDINVHESKLSEIKKIDVGAGEKIPTLQEVIDLCKGKIGLNIEIKQIGIYKQINELIMKNGITEDVMISSFIHEEIALVKKLNPKLYCATLEPRFSGIFHFISSILNLSKYIENAIKINADAIHPFAKNLNKKFCSEAHKQGLMVNTWVSDKEKEWAQLIEKGVDSIITNDPEKLYKFLSKKYNTN